jgi:nitroreductase
MIAGTHPATRVMSVDEALTTTRAVRKRLDLTRLVDPAIITECLALAQQAPSPSNAERFHFVIVTDPGQRAALGDLFRRGFEMYQRLPTSLYAMAHDEQEREAARIRTISSAEYLVEHIDQVPVHVVPCVEGSLEGRPRGYAAVLMAGVIPAAWSFMLAARSRGLATCWTSLHLLPGDGAEADRVLGLPSGVMQVALIATAHPIGRDFKPAYRRPLSEITHYDRW